MADLALPIDVAETGERTAGALPRTRRNWDWLGLLPFFAFLFHFYFFSLVFTFLFYYYFFTLLFTLFTYLSSSSISCSIFLSLFSCSSFLSSSSSCS